MARQGSGAQLCERMSEWLSSARIASLSFGFRRHALLSDQS